MFDSNFVLHLYLKDTNILTKNTQMTKKADDSAVKSKSAVKKVVKTEPLDVFEPPVEKYVRNKLSGRKKKVKKERVHIYITQECLQRVDEKDAELGEIGRSPTIQLLLNTALNDKEINKKIKRKNF